MAERPVIGVVGLGTMGLGIAQVFAQAGFPVLATDASEAVRGTAALRLAGALEARVAAGKLTLAERDAACDRVQVIGSVSGLAAAALVIEAIAERPEAKRALLATLEGVVGPDAVLATNTSSLSVAALAQGLAHPGRVLGLHFFNPAPAMRLVELIAPQGCDQASVDLARRSAVAAGKTVIPCADRPGFIVNRCARPFYGEALALLEEGRPAAEIDAAMLSAGYRIGPFALIDLIGADINLAATESLSAAMGGHARYHVFQALRTQVARGDLGRKTGRGFVFPARAGAPPADADAIILRIEAVLANEAAWLLAEGGTTAEGINQAMMLGLNFPRGPLDGLHRHGPARILHTLAKLEAQAPPHLAGRYVPPPALSEAT
ncbi:MAG: 3-hydroxybutyryl-CoA dehydrogenase [Rhodobacter sp.]|nr:3-hydroxybutyryl-CoA dehydrogenase [Rhodobacter sp.]MCA3520146.1 3-hydroxybutyryl-CoA dehydrogenase [Rhodobacter sp.]MCA3522077.1 3-hydroxybutyryl-CoA dehydrogenase [Rhodobacter sp.]MCA3525321.1 3-hydroxybutyryl-CoA dehydrogenase [Rhodobacter sp.]MCA3527888.1 3-hydroxybutyryl-CoA dehydrogenase [Rhodobacter sp.]